MIDVEIRRENLMVILRSEGPGGRGYTAACLHTLNSAEHWQSKLISHQFRGNGRILQAHGQVRRQDNPAVRIQKLQISSDVSVRSVLRYASFTEVRVVRAALLGIYRDITKTTNKITHMAP